ncbi:hypothetical protein ACFLZH_01310 [Patescibacteria group bacterium]
MEQTQQENQIPQFTFLSLITRTLAGLGGGIVGTVVLLVIYILSVSIVAPVLAPAGDEGATLSPLFIFILMGMIFASTLAANLIAPLFISFTGRGKYQRVTTSLFQLFIVNIVVFLVLIPIYLFSTGIGLEFMSYAAGLQIVFSVLASALIFEIIANYRYALLGVYSTIFAVLLAIAFNIMMYQATGNATILLFLALPVLWGAVGFMFAVVGMLYQWVVKTWGTDYLATFQEYSKDYGITEEVQEVIDERTAEPEPVDEEGVDFLRNKDEQPAEPEQSPAEQAPAEQPPQEQPPVEQPPAEQPPAEQPPVEGEDPNQGAQ